MRDKYEFKIDGCLTVIFWSSGKFFCWNNTFLVLKNCQTKKSVEKMSHYQFWRPTSPILKLNDI